MKILKSEISNKLKALKSFTGKTDKLTVTEGVLISNGMAIATNLELTITMPIDTDEEFIIPPKAIAMINSLPDGMIEILEKNGKIIVKADNATSRFTTSDVSEFPKVAINKGEKLTTIDYNEFSQLVNDVMYAVADTPDVAVHGGVSFYCDGNNLNVAATDGMRIAWTKTAYKDNVDFVIPKSTLKSLLSLGDMGDISIGMSGNKAVFSNDNFTVYTSVLMGEFFNYKSVFDSVNGEVIKTDSKALISALQRAMICADNRPVRLTIESNELNIELMSDVSEYSERININSTVNMVIGVNPKLLVECLKSYDGAVSITVSSPIKPIMIEKDEQKALIMPVRLKD